MYSYWLTSMIDGAIGLYSQRQVMLKQQRDYDQADNRRDYPQMEYYRSDDSAAIHIVSCFGDRINFIILCKHLLPPQSDFDEAV